MAVPVSPSKMQPTDPKRIGGVWAFISRFNALIDWIISLSPSGSTQYDTDWVNCTYEPGYTTGTPGQMRVRRAGKKVTFEGGATGTIIHNAYTKVATLPEGFRPTGNTRSGGFGTSGKPVAIQLAANGDVLFNWNNLGTTATPPTWGGGCFDFWID